MKRVSSVFAAVLLTAIAFVPSIAGGASSTSDQSRIIRISMPRTSGDRISTYWSPRRIAAAQPVSVLLEGEVAPGRPVDDLAYSYPYPFSRFEVPGLPDYSALPYSAIGLVIGTDPDGVDFQCSGASLRSENGNVVWTAGHCVSDGGGGHFENLAFIPAYRDGSEPFGVWEVEDVWVPVKYHQHANRKFDMAALAVAPDATDRELVEVVGGLGFVYDLGPTRHWMILGYPAKKSFDGERQWMCAASESAAGLTESKGPNLIGLGCDMTGGASGGPWILSLGDGDYLNGITIGSYPKFPKAAFSPYFGRAARDLYGCAEDGVC